jgi:predicted amidophosphoribosyltransferase
MKIYVRCGLCGRPVGRRPSELRRRRTIYCSKACQWRTEGLLRQYLADGRFAEVLARELAQNRAQHLDEVTKNLRTLPVPFSHGRQRVAAGS